MFSCFHIFVTVCAYVEIISQTVGILGPGHVMGAFSMWKQSPLLRTEVGGPSAKVILVAIHGTVASNGPW